MLKDKEKRKDILNKVSKLNDQHCEGCEDPRRLRYSNNTQHNNNHYCSNVCPFGKKIREYGRLLEGESPSLASVDKYKRPHIKFYTSRKKLGMSDKLIADEKGVSPSVVSRWKREWAKFNAKN